MENGTKAELHLRPVTAGDVDLLFQWANEKTTRQNAFHKEAIPYETHVGWFERRLEDSDCRIYIGMAEGSPIGQIRIERMKEQKETGLISYSVDVEQRGKGYGTGLLLEAEKLCAKEEPLFVKTLTGQVKPENMASSKAFLRAGYHSIQVESNRNNAENEDALYITYKKDVALREES